MIRQHDQLGDMLCAVPLLRELRKRFPGSSTTLVCSPVNFEIMRFHPFLAATLVYDKRKFSLADYRRFVRGLRSSRFDLAIVPATVSISLTSNLLALLSAAPARIGPGALNGQKNPSESCFTERVELDWRGDPHRHQALRNLDILGPGDTAAGDLTSCIGLTDDETARADARISRVRANHRFVLGVHPGAGKPGNRWPAEKFARLAHLLHHELDAAIMVTAGPMDDTPVAEFGHEMSSPFDLVRNEPIREVAALIDRMDLFISNDTGILHVAGAVRARVLGLFGPTDHLQWAPPGGKNYTLKAADGDMRSITVEEAAEKARTILRRRESGI